MGCDVFRQTTFPPGFTTRCISFLERFTRSGTFLRPNPIVTTSNVYCLQKEIAMHFPCIPFDLCLFAPLLFLCRSQHILTKINADHIPSRSCCFCQCQCQISCSAADIKRISLPADLHPFHRIFFASVYVVENPYGIHLVTSSPQRSKRVMDACFLAFVAYQPLHHPFAFQSRNLRNKRLKSFFPFTTKFGGSMDSQKIPV